MKILFVLTYYRPHWTGLTQYAARLAEGLSDKGHQIEVLCSQHDRSLPREEIISGVKVTRLPFLFRFLRSVVMPGFPLALWRKIKKNESVVVYLPLQEAFIVAIFSWLLKKKLYLVHNGDLVLPAGGGFKNRLIEKVYFWTTAFSIHIAKSIIVQTKDYSRNSRLLSTFRKKWRVILPLYVIPKISRKEVVNFKKANRFKGKILIGFSGRFVEEKGVDCLLRAIPRITKKIPNAHFVFAGDHKIRYENYWEEIKPLINRYRKNITLLGLVRNFRLIYVFYNSLDVYVQPSRTDCFPSSQIEALLSGVPSVCADIPGARWVVKESGMGRIFKANSPEALSEAVVSVCKERKKLIKKLPIVKKMFDYHWTLDRYEKLFQKD